MIATTSSDEKAATLKKLGAHHVINYKSDEKWGETAKSLTPGKLGVQHVVEVGGPITMVQAIKSVAFDGVISIIGFVGGKGKEQQPSFLDCLSNVCTVRGLLVGSRMQFEQMNRAIEANDIKPVVDPKVFGLEQLKEAHQYMVSSSFVEDEDLATDNPPLQWDQKHLGNVCIRID